MEVFQTDALTWDGVQRNSTLAVKWVVILVNRSFQQLSSGTPGAPHTLALV